MLKSFFPILLAASFLWCGCGVQRNASQASRPLPVLRDTAGWHVDTLSSGLVRYHYNGVYPGSSVRENVNVVDIDLTSGRYALKLADVSPRDSLSSICRDVPGALAAVNAGYFVMKTEPQYTFVKAGDSVRATVEAPDTSIFFWKHKGCFYFDNDLRRIGITFGTEKKYEAMDYDNILSSAPVLIYRSKLKGTAFVPKDLPLDKLPYEDPNRHQGTRFPRTAVALTATGHLLFAVVDGKSREAEGMTAAELTRFLAQYFAPYSALNLDGGGSSTLWVDGFPFNGIVNYPTDNKRRDHYGQRRIKTALVVVAR